MSMSELPVGLELVFAENREIEQSNELEKNVVVDYVWNTCRPSPKFSSRTPMVGARRIQLVRIQLQNNPRLLEVRETEMGNMNEEEEDDENDSCDYSFPEQCSGSSSKKRTSDETSSGLDEASPAQCSSSSDMKTVSQKHLECLTETSSSQNSKKKMSGSSSTLSEKAIPSSLDSRKSTSGKSPVCSANIPPSYDTSRTSKEKMSHPSSYWCDNLHPAQQSSCRNTLSEKSPMCSVYDLQDQYSSSGSRKKISERSRECSTDDHQCSRQSSKKMSQTSEVRPEIISSGERSVRSSMKDLDDSPAEVKMSSAKFPQSVSGESAGVEDDEDDDEDDVENDEDTENERIRLILKKGAPVILLRNIEAPRLCNGTRLQIKQLLPHVIEATIMAGPAAGEDVFGPRIPMISSEMGFDFKRIQYPLKLCFAMSINKAQGQSLKVAGLHLETPCFSHGQLYVAFSRVGSSRGLFVLAQNNKTKNIVYRQVLD